MKLLLFALTASAVQVDLGYSIYEGSLQSGLNVWQGIRYAAPPGRWQAPQPPTTNRTVIQANGVPDQCLQAGSNTDVPGSDLDYADRPWGGIGSEDCLFLSVYSPLKARSLPVVVWIHGGGYGLGNGNQNLTDLILANNKSFIGVTIQYRLGAMGFLSSDEVDRYGTVNAGLKDQTFALRWVQKYIRLFGGNPRKVTIFGESAGAGSVMLQSIIYNGNLGTSLFKNVIAASPYLPMQHDYNSYIPTQSYYAFALAAGCFPGVAVGSPSGQGDIFKCLLEQSTATIRNASAIVASSENYGTYGFAPVTDRDYLMQRPSVQFKKRQVNGQRVLSGNNAEEGSNFVPQNVTTEAQLLDYLAETFPLFSKDDISKILEAYPSNMGNAVGVNFATLGDSSPTALDQSAVATGQQQRVNNIYAETTFVCPSYWLAEGFSSPGHGAYKYQYSVPAAIHSTEETAYFGGSQPNIGPDFMKAFMTIYGNFITKGDPSIPSSIAHGDHANTTRSKPNPISNWPRYTLDKPLQINLNETGGQEFTALTGGFLDKLIFAREHQGPGLRNDIRLVNAYDWEGGRGKRCEFWREMGALVPE
ncbi:carboxylesterase type B [Cadophora sp. DSE1049]|nr:carboxylesterase type B [Cadophora sp. DSE1049]